MDAPKPPSKPSAPLRIPKEFTDLPLFSPRPAGKGSRENPLPLKPRRSHRAYILPLLGLLIFFSGIGMLIPKGLDPKGSDFVPPDTSLPTIVVDAGHGGKDSGASGNGLREKDLALDTALRLEAQLRLRGFPVVLTRRDDTFLELYERAGIANKIPRALFVSIHFNDNVSTSGDGVETFYAEAKAPFTGEGWTFAGMFKQKPEPPPADMGAAFAQSVQSALVRQLGAVDRGAKPRQLAVVRLTRCAAVLVEGGFLNNPTEARRLAAPAYRERLASAIADGVSSYQLVREAEARSAKLAQK